MTSNTTPLMEQYNQIKSKYPGALLLFRVGDFYETFGEDAIKTSQILGIVLTKRANGNATTVELAGFPYHALDTYLPKLVKAGYRVAICDQLEDPKMAKGIVKRGVRELVTPGLSYHDHVLTQRNNNYLASLYFEKTLVGVAFLDISTGEFLTAQGNIAYVEKLMQSFQPAEVLICKKQQMDFQSFTKDQYPFYALDDWGYQLTYAQEMLKAQFGTASIKGFGIENLPLGIIASGAILRYLEETSHQEKKHITSIARIEEDKYVWLDKFTIRNLEILAPQQEGGVSLIEILDKTITPMGARLLKKWIVLPLKDLKAIQKRLDTVSLFIKNDALTQILIQELKQMGDLERLIAKVSAGRATPRDLLALQKDLQHTLPIQDQLQKSQEDTLVKLSQQLHNCSYLVDKIQKILQENPPLSTTQGGLIKSGIHAELDELRNMAYEGKNYLLELQQKEIQRTGISSLKIAYNRVFGYYLEVTNAHKDKVPVSWIRKQTLANAERYVTEDLKSYEEKILQAESKIIAIEQEIYQTLIDSAAEFVPQVLHNAKVIAQLDCYLCFAQQAIKYQYTKPILSKDKKIHLQGSRHPVIERQLPPDVRYVANDVYLDEQNQQILIITGPNMSGKSALLRQVALIVLMAQIGAFVPAEKAEISVVDKIFTRVGASDNLAMGESTFMVEMTETASIMHNLSNQSLVIMDEIGRGTSTYDGIAIAWSLVEYLHNHPRYKAKTLFATHYHELNQLEKQLLRVKNFHISVKEIQGKIIFLRKLKPGGSEHSFGIHVAKLAGMPNQVVDRATAVMLQLENDKTCTSIHKKMDFLPTNTYQFSLVDPDIQNIKTIEILNQLDIDTLTPIEALLKLRELKSLLPTNQ